MKNILLIFSTIGLLVACSSSKKTVSGQTFPLQPVPQISGNHFTGLLVVDPATRDTLFGLNHNAYFTPASNVKIVTLYTALQLLEDRVPVIDYLLQNDTLYIKGLGDPTQLHPYFKDSTLVNFLKTHSNIVLDPTCLVDNPFGPGWAWEDYSYTFSPERSPLPLYGNVVTLIQDDSLRVVPTLFSKKTVRKKTRFLREQHDNLFYHQLQPEDTLRIPFITDPKLTASLLEKTTGSTVHTQNRFPNGAKSRLYGLPTDSILKPMMHQSDNFLAEQLLVMASATLSDTLDTAHVRDHILQNELSGLRQPPLWVDGSGLSRYNLFTPESLVFVLEKLYRELPRERLLGFFPVAGISGTLKNGFERDEKPFIYAKSGSLSNNYNLSGYLIAKSGKILLFSYMNNHFRMPTDSLKAHMQKVLRQIRDTY